MTVVITAGGTAENIDQVRKISNTATGRLASLIAEEFYTSAGADVIYVCGYHSLIPSTPAQLIRVGPVSQLKSVIEDLLSHKTADAFIHTMAVGDYAVSGLSSIEKLAASLSVLKSIPSSIAHSDIEEILRTAFKQSILNTSEKISSDIDGLVMLMEKTPKVLSIIKELQPKTLLVGFKLLSGVEENTLLKIGHELLIRNNCDFVFANDLKHISGDNHMGILICPDMSYSRLYTKQSIASAIAAAVLKKINWRG